MKNIIETINESRVSFTKDEVSTIAAFMMSLGEEKVIEMLKKDTNMKVNEKEWENLFYKFNIFLTQD